MQESVSRTSLCLLVATLLGCGGGQTAESTTADNAVTDAPAEDEDTPGADPADPEDDQEDDEEDGADGRPAREAAPPTPPPTPRPQPITAGSAEEIHAAILAASRGEAALHRLIDPVWGVGTHNTSDTGSGIVHHCDVEEVSSHPGTAFSVQPDDRWSCDRNLRRCQSSARDGGGYVFHFRSAGSGNAVWLNAIIHHTRAVPSRDSAAVRSFVSSGEGVCDLFRTLTDGNSTPPSRFSVFVGGHTGLVPETLREHHCGAEARDHFIERVRGLPRGQTLACTRNPTRCSIQSGDEQYTFYGGSDGAMAIALTRPGMFANLERAQAGEVASFLRAFSSASCDD